MKFNVLFLLPFADLSAFPPLTFSSLHFFLLPQCSSSVPPPLISPSLCLFSPPQMSHFIQIQVFTLCFLWFLSLTPLLFLSINTSHCLSFIVSISVFSNFFPSVLPSFFYLCPFVSFLLSVTSIFPFSFSALSAAPHRPFPNFFSPFAVFLPHLSVFPPSFCKLHAVLSPPTAPRVSLLFVFCVSGQRKKNI